MSDSQDETELKGQAPAETSETDSPDVEATPRESPGRRSVWPWLLLILVLLGAGAGGWMQYQNQQQQTQSLVNIDERIEKVEAELAIEAALGERLTELEAVLENRSRSADQQLQLLQDQIVAMGQNLENLAGQDATDRSQWLISEAAYYLRVGNAQMALAGNAAVASRALSMADEKLRQVGDPRLTPVRRAISEEIAELNAMPQADVEGVVLRLDALGKRIPELPLKQQAPDRFDEREARVEPSASGLSRAWEAIKAAFSTLVRIRPSEVAPESLASPSQELLLVKGVEAEISVAKLAYLQGEGMVFRSAVDETIRRLTLHFDMQNPEVLATVAALDEIGGSEISPARPDISGSLGLLMELDSGAAAP